MKLRKDHSPERCYAVITMSLFTGGKPFAVEGGPNPRLPENVTSGECRGSG